MNRNDDWETGFIRSMAYHHHINGRKAYVRTDDDWQKFCEMMASAGWRYMPEDSSTRTNGEGLHLFEHANGSGYLSDGYWYAPGKDGPSRNIGDWRKWLGAGQTPPPF